MILKCTLIGDQRPYNIVYTTALSYMSYIYVPEEDFIAFITNDADSLDWYFFLDGARTEWTELNDDQRMLVRIKANVLNDCYPWPSYDPGEYKDSRYYTLEALGNL